MKYVVLLRGINVGGKNKLRMAELKTHLEDLGFKNVATYIQSGNVIFESDKSADDAAQLIEGSLPKKFKLDSELIKAFVFSRRQFENIMAKAPKGFGLEPEKYHYDFLFLKGVSSREAIKEFDPHPEVDGVWTGPSVIYHRRLSVLLSRSRLSKTAGKPIYKSMTVRSWTTAAKLLALLTEGK